MASIEPGGSSFRVGGEASLLTVEKTEHRPKLLGPDILWCGGGLPREGVGPMSSVCPSKPTEKTNFVV